MEDPLVTSPGAANGLSAAKQPAPTSTSIDPQLIVDHLTKVLSVTLGASEEDLSAPGSLLSEPLLADTLQRCTRFALESQVALYVQRVIGDHEQTEGTNGSEGSSSSRLRFRSLLIFHFV